MSKYYVNDDAQSSGNHEVHQNNCYFLSLTISKTYLGEYINCLGAVIEAKKKYPTADGCASCSPVTQVREKLIKSYQFRDYNFRIQLQELYKTGKFSANEKEFIFKNFSEGIKFCGYDEIIYTYNKLIEWEIDLTSIDLLRSSVDKVFYKSDLIELFKLSESNTDEENIKKILSNNRGRYSFSDRLEILKALCNNIHAGIIAIYFFEPELWTKPDAGKFLRQLLAATPQAIKIFVETREQEILEKYTGYFLRLAIKSKCKNAIEKSLAKINFRSEQDLGLIIFEIADYSLQDFIAGTDLPIAALVSFNKKDVGEVTFSSAVRKALSNYRRSAENYLIKYLVWQYYGAVISRDELNKFLVNHEWVTISALLLKSFIGAPDHQEKLLLGHLNQVFFEHFELLRDEQNEMKSFLETFTIGGIVTKCRGRTHYNFEKKQVNGIERFEIRGNEPEVRMKEKLDCYCEGRIWRKQQEFHNSSTGRVVEKKFDLYWCKNSHCVQVNNVVDLSQPFYKWTLYDISEALGLQVEHSAMSTLAGWANRVSEITTSLSCRQCRHVLRPVPFNARILGYYAVPIFNCINRECSSHGIPIRFTHCQNGKCHKLLDSRDNEKCCSSGLKCRYCETTCPKCNGARPVLASW